MKKLAYFLLIALYVLAGINHFWHPQFYLRLIPPYLPWHTLINYVAGLVELVLGIAVALSATRRRAAIGIIILLILFIPSHVYSLQIACDGNTNCPIYWIALVRFVLIHPLLIAWAWWMSKA